MKMQQMPSPQQPYSLENRCGRTILQTLMYVCLISLVCICLYQPNPILAQGSEKTFSEVKEGYHFVLLLDDSGDMGAGHKAEIINSLPAQLFRGINTGNPDDPLSLRPFDPEQDQISALFFTIHGQKQGATAEPDKMFQLAYAGGLRGESDLVARLREWFGRSGRSSGNYSHSHIFKRSCPKRNCIEEPFSSLQPTVDTMCPHPDTS
jgi:hypothetical protein